MADIVEGLEWTQRAQITANPIPVTKVTSEQQATTKKRGETGIKIRVGENTDTAANASKTNDAVNT